MTTTYRVSELVGELLAHAVALACGYRVVLEGSQPVVYLPNGVPRSFSKCGWRPDLSWTHGGPLVGQHISEIFRAKRDSTGLNRYGAECEGADGWGDTMLIAAMRALVTAKLGEEVEL